MQSGPREDDACLLMVDIQNDFLPGGALAVPEGDRIIPIVNRLMDLFKLVVATQDWHPPDHGSFAANHPGRKTFEHVQLNGLPQTLWPIHCVQGTPGAELSASLRQDRITHRIHKGVDPGIDSYSAFFDNAWRKSTGLGDWLTARDVKRLFICGLATDYCVKFSVLDGLKLGFDAYLVVDACRGVNLQPTDAEHAVEEMRAAGAHVVMSQEVFGAKLP